MTRSTTLVAAAAALTLSSAGALADATATASFSDLHIELIDMNPDDGIAPSVTFGPDNSTVATQAWTSNPYALDLKDAHGDGAFGAVATSSMPNRYVQGSASISGDVNAGTGSALASAFVDTTTIGGASSSGQVALTGPLNMGSSFILSAGTVMTISATGDVTAAATNSFQSRDAFANSFLLLELWGEGQVSLGELYVHAGTDAQGFDSRHADIEVLFVNGSDVATSGFFEGTLSSQAEFATPIPEPASAILMLFGLSTIGFVGVGRRRRAFTV
jgi:hypothetical protein